MIGPDGTTINYTYDDGGNLISARNLSLGQSDRYGYEADGEGRLIIAGAPVGEAGGELIDYRNTIAIAPIQGDLGSAYQFTQQTISGNLDDGGDRYLLSLRDSELASTATDFVLVGVEIDGANVSPLLSGVSPLTIQQLDSNTTFAIFAIQEAGLNLLEISGSGDYTLDFSIIGDVNLDGRVNGLDSELLSAISGSLPGDATYQIPFDLNRDGAINATDTQLLGSNFGFITNLPPIVSSTSILTHKDLSIRIALADLAEDAEGDELFFRVMDPVDGQVVLDTSGEYAIFRPNEDFIGSTSFTLTVDDGYGSSSTTLSIDVSDAALLNLHFVSRGPALNIGESQQLQVIGDFADQKGVVLDGDYLDFSSTSPDSVLVSETGLLTGLSAGTPIITTSKGEIQAFTSVPVGGLEERYGDVIDTPSGFNLALASFNGSLDLYPDTVTLLPGSTRQIYINIDDPTFKNDELILLPEGTQFFSSNSNILEVDSRGLVTARGTGVAEIYVFYGDTETIIPISVQAAEQNSSVINDDGGAVSSEGGSTILVGPNTLPEGTTVTISDLGTPDFPLPDLGMELLRGFELDFSGNALANPAQIVVEAPAHLDVGTRIVFMRLGELPDSNGIMQTTWLQAEEGYVDEDGLIRTQSPPYPGVNYEGQWYFFADLDAPDLNLIIDFAINNFGEEGGGTQDSLALLNAIQNNLPDVGTLEVRKGEVNVSFDIFSDFVSIGLRTISGSLGSLVGGGSIAQGALVTPQIPLRVPTYSVSSLEVVAIPTKGLPIITPLDIRFDPEQGFVYDIDFRNFPAAGDGDPLEKPTITGTQFRIDPTSGLPTLLILGQNLSTEASTKTTVNFSVGEHVIEGNILELKESKIVVEVPNSISIGSASVEVVRTEYQNSLPGVDPRSFDFISESVNVNVQSDRILGALRFNDQVAVINPETQSLFAQIPVGDENHDDWPDSIAITNKGDRAYVSLNRTGEIALVDPAAIRQVDVNPSTTRVDAIKLPPGAAPTAVIVDDLDRYMYVADGRADAEGQSRIYVIDIDPNSASYNQHLHTISVKSAPYGIKSLTIANRGKFLLATAPGSNRREVRENSNILVINIDSDERLKAANGQASVWRQQTDTIETPFGTAGISATPDPNTVVFTNQYDDSQGYGILRFVSDKKEGEFSAPEVQYVDLTLGLEHDWFDVNDAVSVVVTDDLEYGFVAAFNRPYVIEGLDDRNPFSGDIPAGSNIGIIKDPLGLTESGPDLVAATRPIPFGFTSDLVLSASNDQLYVSYPGIALEDISKSDNGFQNGAVLVYDVSKIRKAVEEFEGVDESSGINTEQDPNDIDPGNTIPDLHEIPINDIVFPGIDIKAAYKITEADPLRGQFKFGVDPNYPDRAPIVTGGSIRDLAISSNFLTLNNIALEPGDLTPTLSWDVEIPEESIQEVQLFISTFEEGEGLFPWDPILDLKDPSLLPALSEARKEEFLTEEILGFNDFNPYRVLNANWLRTKDDWAIVTPFTDLGAQIQAQLGAVQSGSKDAGEDPDSDFNFGTNLEFTLPEELQLTANQTYHLGSSCNYRFGY